MPLILEGSVAAASIMCVVASGMVPGLPWGVGAAGWSGMLVINSILIGRTIRSAVLGQNTGERWLSPCVQHRLMSMHVRVFAIKLVAVVALVKLLPEVVPGEAAADPVRRAALASCMLLLLLAPGGRLPRPGRGEV